MSQSARRRPNYLAIIALLLLAQVSVLAVKLSARPAHLPAPDTSAFPMKLGGWQGTSYQLDKVSQEMLRPEAYLLRNYTDEAGQLVGLTVIYGHGKSNFHSPALCFLGGGWNILAKDKVFVQIGANSREARLQMVRLVLQKGEYRVLVLYSFLSPGRSTANWALFQQRLLGVRLLGRQPSGALLRLVVPIQGSQAAAEQTAQGFLAQAYPRLRRILAL